MAARFEFHVSPGTTSTQPGVFWRLLSKNNRDLGRSPAHFAEYDHCLASLVRLRDELADASPTIHRITATAWTWRLEVAVRPVAMASRAYERRIQADIACEIFLGLVHVAEIVESVRYRRS